MGGKSLSLSCKMLHVLTGVSCSIHLIVCTIGLRRRRREVLEEEQDLDEESFNQLAAGHDADGLPGDHCLPEDTTGAQFGVLWCRLLLLFFSHGWQ